jgi:hypothetical protein
MCWSSSCKKAEDNNYNRNKYKKDPADGSFLMEILMLYLWRENLVLFLPGGLPKIIMEVYNRLTCNYFTRLKTSAQATPGDIFLEKFFL